MTADCVEPVLSSEDYETPEGVAFTVSFRENPELRLLDVRLGMTASTMLKLKAGIYGDLRYNFITRMVDEDCLNKWFLWSDLPYGIFASGFQARPMRPEFCLSDSSFVALSDQFLKAADQCRSVIRASVLKSRMSGRMAKINPEDRAVLVECETSVVKDERGLSQSSHYWCYPQRHFWEWELVEQPHMGWKFGGDGRPLYAKIVNCRDHQNKVSKIDTGVRQYFRERGFFDAESRERSFRSIYE